MDPIARGNWWTQRIAAVDRDRARVLVAEHEGIVVGFSAVGPSTTGEAHTGAVYTLYLDPPCWGRGIGRSLFAGAQSALVDLGYAQAVLWVAEANVRARRFYESVGWAHDGGVQTDESFGWPVTEVRYRGALPSHDG